MLWIRSVDGSEYEKIQFNGKIMMEKLLFMGCSFGTEEALKYAQSKGIYTIVTDYNPPERSRLKEIADEYWMIDLKDLDQLEQKCRQENVKHFFSATSEFCLDQTKELCRRLNVPFYASEEGWLCSRDKKKFKQYCMECGLNTPRTWLIGDQLTLDVLKHIAYPVIVKPTDSCAEQGISVCNNEEELYKGFEMARAYSASGQIVVEEYIVGEEMVPLYFLLDGKAVLAELDDLVYLPVGERNNFVFVKNCSHSMDTYLREIHPKVQQLFRRMGCRDGVAFLQGIWRDGIFYFFEMGYRLDGTGVWKRAQKLCGYSALEFMVELAMHRRPKELPDVCKIQTNPDPNRKIAGTYLLWANPGKIARIQGADVVSKISDTEIIIDRFKVGDTVPEQISMKRIAFNMIIMAVSVKDMIEKVKAINEALHMYDEEGKEMLIHLTDYSSIESWP